MTIQQQIASPMAAGAVPVLPETAPFTPEQRSWLNGFFAGLLSLEAPGAVPATGLALPGAAASEADDGAPWHDPAMAIDERMKLAEGKPKRRQLFAAMAQQNCGQCGYQCESYADALASGAETKPNLCVPGGKDTSRALKKLLEDESTVATATAEVASSVAPAVTAATDAGYSRDAPVQALFKSAVRLNGAGSEKDTRHVVFDISSSGISYQPGDSFGVYARNEPSLVNAVLAAMKAPADFPIGGKTFREALIEDYSLGAAPDMLFELLSYLVGGDRRRRAKLIAKGGDPDGDAASLDVLAALEKFGPVHPDPEAFLECLEPLQPRLYSISSSPVATPGELHLTVDAVRYSIDGRQRLGLASTFLADRLGADEPVRVYLQKAHGFALPKDDATPIIMVGPGTGVAPFRSFLWHRNATHAKGRAWLFFGHQREASDFYYRDELDQLQRDGTLTRLSTAWSRDGTAKVYVQDKMRDAGADLWAWMSEGAHFYICGDAKRMAKDVESALVDIAAGYGGKSAEDARKLLQQWKSEGRYQADVY